MKREFWRIIKIESVQNQGYRFIRECWQAAPWKRATVYQMPTFGDSTFLRLVIEESAD